MISLTSPYDALLLAASAVIVLVMAVVFSWFIVRVKQTIKEQNSANTILTDILTNVYAVSYTHLTLPTICSV